MSNFKTFQVFPMIPESLKFLEVLGMNFWWSWKRDAGELFRRIDPYTWDKSGRNPIVFLTQIPQARLEQIASDTSYLSHLKEVEEEFNFRVKREIQNPYSPFKPNETIAYFSMEFGIHESLPLFAGGLGILAGDHLKSASDMEIPLTGIGLLFRRGYFRQILSPDGMQQEEYPETDYYHLPIARATNQDGTDIRIEVDGPDGLIQADVWKINVGRVKLYLLDTNLYENPPAIRNITANLYAGDAKTRLSQEVLLGIGGMKALEALGIYPKVCHMNEGHCAFCGVERLAQVIKKYGVDFKTAMEIVPRITIFTTHTPVAAGHDEFDADHVLPVLKPYAKFFDLPAEEILALGQINGPDLNQPVSMFVLAMHLSQFRNGVSELHGKTARHMWSHVWPGVPSDEIPISHITNGIHISSFISPEFAILFDRYLGPDWYMASRIQQNIYRIENIPDEELWWAHELNRARLINFCRNRLVSRYRRQNAPLTTIEEAETILDNDVLTIGFARRFATYKRADLLLRDPLRLSSMLGSEDRPVQFIFSGKAHPKDNEGKEIIRRLIEFSRSHLAKNRIIFLEDYDMNVARYLVQGADAWLNTPRRPFEACGTSGMKAAINGVINISILDGWWNEGYSDSAGWAIGHGDIYSDANYQDIIESQALYNVLENDVIPAFYNRKSGDVSTQWLNRMKVSMKLIMSRFCSMKMIDEYDRRFYAPSAIRHDELLADQAKEAMEISQRVKRYRMLWNRIHVEMPERERSGSFRVGDSFKIMANVFLGDLHPSEVEVELYYGPIKLVENLESGNTEVMSVRESLVNGYFIYECSLTCMNSGRFGFTVRVKPRGDDRLKLTPYMITWA
jgi:starch phosphorylase